MNITLWIFQALLAAHTAMGAVWKFSNSAQAVPSLSAIPHTVWLMMAGLELLVSLGLVVPSLVGSLGFLVPIAAASIALEMLAFVALHLRSGHSASGEIIYWLVVAAVCAFVAYGRLAIRPL
jgi:hypothetical protein